MRLHRVYTDQALTPGADVAIEGGRAHYLTRVLRVTAEQPVVLFNGDGHDYAADVLVPGKQRVRLRVNSRLPSVPESPLHITVAQAVSRGERMDQTLQKCTELGAAAFQPLWSERVEVRLEGDKLTRRLEHWQGVVAAACEQCGRATVPGVNPPLALTEWLMQGDPETVRIVLDPLAERALSDWEQGSRVTLVVGPEGGFSEVEVALLGRSGADAYSLGPRVLRTETAAPAAVAVLQSLAGDFR